jgi:type II secretory pathway pseudopilin PulG
MSQNPYAPTELMSQQPNASPVYHVYNPQLETIGTSSTPQPPQKKGRSKMVLVAVIALMAIIGGSVFGVVAYNNNNQATMHANATATANAQIKSQATANMQATATAVASTYPSSNKLVLNDPLTDNSRGVSWDVNSHCSFSGSAYHAIVDKAGYYYPCIANKTSFSNFTFEVQMTIKQGDNSTSGGLIFRASPNDRQYMLFLDTQGNYDFEVSVDRTGTNSRIVKRGQVTGFTAGLYLVHTLGVVANGNQISLYVDQQSVMQLTDPTYTSGEIGILAYSAGSTADVAYNNLKVWQL